MRSLASRFIQESNLELHSFLRESMASRLRSSLLDLDMQDGLGPSRGGLIPLHLAGTASGKWTIKGPPHKWRYCVLPPTTQVEPSTIDALSPEQSSPENLLRRLQEELFSSEAFRAWLTMVSNVLPLGYAVEARRFRPGLDYTLATSEEKESRLDVVLGLTPEVGTDLGMGSGNVKGKAAQREKRPESKGWQSGEWGGWEASFLSF
jgi:hypothetical protein